MRTLWISILLLVFSLAGSAADLAGKYKGSWTGGAANGDIAMSFSKGDDGAWKAEVSFTISGQDVKCKVKSTKVDGAKVEVVYDFSFGDTTLESTATAELKDKTLEGTYKTKSIDDGSAVDEGTWIVTAS